MPAPFHLAFPVVDLQATAAFFEDTLGCTRGRESPDWVDFNLYGHQITAHRVDAMPSVPTNLVDGKAVPVQHFGVILDWADWEALGARLRAAGVEFLIEPVLRFRGKIGEQGTFFLLDPSGNALEFKSFPTGERAVFERDG